MDLSQESQSSGKEIKALTSLKTIDLSNNRLNEALLPELDTTIPAVGYCLLRNNAFPPREPWRPHIPDWAKDNVLYVRPPNPEEA